MVAKLNIHIFNQDGEERISTIWTSADYSYEEIKVDFVEKFYPDYVDFFIEEVEECEHIHS